MATKIYIAGKITGDPDYKAKFEEAENFYKKMGFTVLTPTCLPIGMQPADYMRICFAPCPYYRGKEYDCEEPVITRPPQSWCYVEGRKDR